MTTLMDQAGQSQAQPDQFDDAQQQSNDQPQVNVGHNERVYSAGAGGLLALLGLKRGGLGGLLMIGAGAALVRRGYSGHCPAYEKLGMRSTDKAAEPQEYFER